ncbi:hypothetical protein ABW21_db0201985 [Orbilia brochopaga]|nr:hypothetical protein ABW21_db0201985 [Drechslerella brochopaga]
MPSWPLEPIDLVSPITSHQRSKSKSLKCQFLSSYNQIKGTDRRTQIESNPAALFGILTDHGSDNNGGLKQFRMHSIAPSSATLVETRLPFVRDMHAIANVHTPSLDASLEAALVTCRHNHAALEALLAFLDPATLSTAADSSSIFEHFLFNGAPNVISFSGATFGFPRIHPTPNIRHVQHLHIRGSPPSRPLYAHKSVNIVTSACLWSADVVSTLSQQLIDLFANATSTCQSRLPGSLLNHPFTLSELDTISRLSNSVADLACTIFTSSLSANQPIKVAITLDIPRIQYYLSGPCSHFHNPGILAAWTTIVDARKAQIERTFAQCIATEIARRIPLSEGNCSYTINLSDGLDAIRPFIVQSVASTSTHKTDVQECIHHLRRAIPEWETFFSRLPGAAPTTLEELWCLSYVYEIVRPFLVAIGSPDSSNTHVVDDVLILQVDNIFESKPYMKARRFLEAYIKARRKNGKRAAKKQHDSGVPSAKLIGIYPCERIFYSKGGTQRSSLHKFDPGMKFAAEETSTMISAAELLEQVYGVETTSSLMAPDERPF